jgi:hypothetical protein
MPACTNAAIISLLYVKEGKNTKLPSIAPHDYRTGAEIKRSTKYKFSKIVIASTLVTIMSARHLAKSYRIPIIT